VLRTVLSILDRDDVHAVLRTVLSILDRD